MTNQTIFTVGGTVQAGGGVYIKRKADDELLELCRKSEFAFILSSRQVGKSSLMVRTARQLDNENIRSVIIDLSAIGVKISADEWYLGILDEIATTLKLKTDIFVWWLERAGLGPAQRLTNFFRDVLLKEVAEPVVLFFDEIDSTLSIPFADDFFAALRSIYNARSTIADFKRLSFVMIGVATPSDLIADDKRTPFNIGHRVDLTDFTLEEALPFAGELGAQTLGWVFSWTGGHPYLTQRLCEYLSKDNTEITEETVADAVKKLFGGEQGRQDNNLQFVRDMLTKRAPDIQRVLKTYKDIRLGKKVSDDERSIPKAHLKISGVVRRENGNLQPRNRIYERTFDLAWVKENTPPTTTRRLVIALSFVTVLALMIAGYFAWQDYNRTPAEHAAQYEGGFQIAKSSAVRLKNLAGLFKLGDETYASDARTLFSGLSQQDKLTLFAPNNAWGAHDNQVIVVKGLYQHLGNTEDENKLLGEMAKAAPPFNDEITLWLAGRKGLNEKDYFSAMANLGLAITKNPENPTLYYDRAQVYIGLGNDYYSKALSDLNTMVQLDKNRVSDATGLIHNENKPFAEYWKYHIKDIQHVVLPLIPALGIDVSHWNSVDSEIDWSLVRNSGIDFAFIKATEGINYKDDTFEKNWAGTKSIGILRGAYHTFRANVDPAKQAKYFIQIVKAMGDNGELPPVLVLKTNDGISKEKFIASVKIWLDLVEQGLGRKPIIYSYPGFLQDYFTEVNGESPAWAKEYPLWLAQYPDPGQFVEGMEPTLPHGWSTWDFWQFSYSAKGMVDGISAGVQLELFNGAPSDLLQLLISSNNISAQTELHALTFESTDILTQLSIVVPPPIDGSRAWGIDVSYWDAEIDWSRLKNLGIDFVFMKATEGNYYKDPTLERNWLGAKSVGIPRGVYHFFRCNVDAKKQAEYFIQYVKETGDNSELPPVLDLETSDGKSKEQIIRAVKIWLDLVEQGLGRKPVIYIGKSFFEEYLSEANGAPPIWVNDYIFWLAGDGRYIHNNYFDTLEPHLPQNLPNWSFWQYTDRGGVDGINASTDLNVFNGSRNDFQKFLIESASQTSK